MKFRVLRGGSYYSESGYLRTTCLNFLVPERWVGFRVVVVKRRKP